MIWRAVCAAIRPKSCGVMAISSHWPTWHSGSRTRASSSEISSQGSVDFVDDFFLSEDFDLACFGVDLNGDVLADAFDAFAGSGAERLFDRH